MHFERVLGPERVAAPGEEEVKDATHGPGVAVLRHPVVDVQFVEDAFGSQPSSLAVMLSDAVAARFVGPFAKAEVGDDEPIAADRDQDIGRADVAVDVILLVDVRHPEGQLAQSFQFAGDWSVVLGNSPLVKIGGGKLEREIPAHK